MRRRDLIAVLGGVAATWPLMARTQQAMPLVGFINGASRAPDNFAAFRQGPVFDDKAGADESIRVARDWIAKNAANISAPAPIVSEGSVVLQVKER